MPAQRTRLELEMGSAMATDSAADVQCIGPVTAAEVRGHVVPIVPAAETYTEIGKRPTISIHNNIAHFAQDDIVAYII